MLRCSNRKLIVSRFLLKNSSTIHRYKIHKSKRLKSHETDTKSTLNRVSVMAHRGKNPVNNTNQQQQQQQQRRRYNNAENSSNYSNIRTVIPSNLQNVAYQQQWRQERWRQQESTMVYHPRNDYNFHHPFHNPNFYNNTPNHMVLQPNLSLAYFHRQEQRRNTPKTSPNGRGDFSLNGLRFWDQLSPKPQKNTGFNFTVMSYNVLAQDLVQQHPYLYTFHTGKFLNWDIRWANIIREIKRFKPDILCMQEVQDSHLDQYYSQLDRLGYRGVYKRRTGIRTDGCAIYYKENLLTMVEHITVEFNQPDVSILNRDNVAIVAKFFPKRYPNNEFVVATTHLLYNIKRNDVRLAQIQVLMAEIDRIAFKSISTYLPTILTGDLNSDPNSAVYQFITRGVLDYARLSLRPFAQGTQQLVPPSLRITDQCQHANLLPHRGIVNGDLPRSEELKLINLKHSERDCSRGKSSAMSVNDELFSSGVLSHKFSLRSIYDHGRIDDPEGTTYQDRWLSVDYIFYSDNNNSVGKLVPLERFKLPTRNQLGDLKIPNKELGSDHLSLLARFQLIIPNVS